MSVKAFDLEPLLTFIRENTPEAIWGDWLDVSLHIQREIDAGERVIGRVFLKSLGDVCHALIDVHYAHPIWPSVVAFAAAYSAEDDTWMMLRLRYLADGTCDYDALDPAHYGWH